MYLYRSQFIHFLTENIIYKDLRVMNTYLFSREMKKDSDKEKARQELLANSYKKAKMKNILAVNLKHLKQIQ